MVSGGIALSPRIRSFLVPALALLAVSVSALISARPAAAATCWQRVLSDWKDGRIDGTYSASCLRAAIGNMPEDLKIYGSAEDDIRRLLNGIQARSLAARHAPASPSPAAKASTEASTSKAEATSAAGSRSLAGREAKPKRQPAQRVAAAAKAHAEPAGGLPLRTLLLIVSAVTAVSVFGLASVRGLRD